MIYKPKNIIQNKGRAILLSDYFEVDYDEDNEAIWYKYDKLSNNQTIYIAFNEVWYQNFVSFTVILAISNKKKHIKKWLDEQQSIIEGMTTGTCGIEGLLWAKNKILLFEKIVKNSYPRENVQIELSWIDTKRKRVYKRLEKYGYKYNKQEKILFKKLY